MARRLFIHSPPECSSQLPPPHQHSHSDSSSQTAPALLLQGQETFSQRENGDITHTRTFKHPGAAQHIDGRAKCTASMTVENT